MKKVVFLVLLVLCAAFMFVSCSNATPDAFVPIVFDEKVSNIEDGQVLAPNSVVRLAWADSQGNEVPCDFVLTRNGAEVENMKNVTEVVVAVTEEGSYEGILTVAGARAESKKISFKVSNLYRELYQSSNGIVYVDDVDGNLTGTATDVLIKFYKYSSYVLPGTDEVINDRKRMTLVDTNQDGIYDAWELYDSADAAHHPYVQFANPLNAYGVNWYVKGFVYYENKIQIQYSGTGVYTGYTLTSTFATVGFDLNVPHARIVALTEGKLPDGSASAYNTFMLRERYNSDNKPVFELETTAPVSSERGTTFEVKVSADNVADFAEVYDTKYMQLGVKFDDSLALTKVEFPNFFDGLRETSAYKLNETNDAVILYKAVLDGAENTGAAPSTDFAVLTFEVKPITEATNANISLVYEGFWNTYVTYPDAPNAMWKDADNRNVDGYLIDVNPINVEFGGEVE